MEIANIVRLKPDKVSLLLWTCGSSPECNPESLCCGPMTSSFDKLSGAMSTILAAMECPICFDTIPPPVIQCQNGHLICASCRRRSERCPVCREKYSAGRSLIAEQIFTSLTDAFNLPNNEKLRERLFGGKFIRASDLKYINIQSLTQRSHTQKFLARLMGRSSSLENLSTIRKSLPLSVADEKFKSSKSQSTTEIFQENNNYLGCATLPIKCGNIRKPISAAQSLECLKQVCRHPSSSSLSVKKSSLTSSSSSSSSCENLGPSSKSLTTTTPPQLFVPKLQHLSCVLDAACPKMTTSSELRRHINEDHQIPILSFAGSCTAKIRLPPVEPMDKAFLVFRQGVHRHIWLRLHCDEEMLFCAALLERTPTSAVSKIGSEAFILETSIKREAGQKELIDRCDVEESRCWSSLLKERKGIYYSKEALKSTLDSDQLLLTVRILQKNGN